MYCAAWSGSFLDKFVIKPIVILVYYWGTFILVLFSSAAQSHRIMMQKVWRGTLDSVMVISH